MLLIADIHGVGPDGRPYSQGDTLPPSYVEANRKWADHLAQALGAHWTPDSTEKSDDVTPAVEVKDAEAKFERKSEMEG